MFLAGLDNTILVSAVVVILQEAIILSIALSSPLVNGIGEFTFTLMLEMCSHKVRTSFTCLSPRWYVRPTISQLATQWCTSMDVDEVLSQYQLQ